VVIAGTVGSSCIVPGAMIVDPEVMLLLVAAGLRQSARSHTLRICVPLVARSSRYRRTLCFTTLRPTGCHPTTMCSTALHTLSAGRTLSIHCEVLGCQPKVRRCMYGAVHNVVIYRIEFINPSG
jgi:hypothetical protein